MRVKWTSNKNRGDNTARLKLASGEVLVRGQEADVTEEEYERLSKRRRLVKQGEEQTQPSGEGVNEGEQPPAEPSAAQPRPRK